MTVKNFFRVDISEPPFQLEYFTLHIISITWYTATDLLNIGEGPSNATNAKVPQQEKDHFFFLQQQGREDRSSMLNSSSLARAQIYISGLIALL
jgi:hypothetical protein